MYLEKWNSRNLPLIETMMDNFFAKGDSYLRPTDLGLKVPAANVVDGESSYEIELAVPGKQKEDFKIEIENGAISISSQTETTKESDNKSFARKEYSYESFERSFRLPENVKESAIEATYTDGVLKIVLPKASDTQPKVKTVAIS